MGVSESVLSSGEEKSRSEAISTGTSKPHKKKKPAFLYAVQYDIYGSNSLYCDSRDECVVDDGFEEETDIDCDDTDVDFDEDYSYSKSRKLKRRKSVVKVKSFNRHRSRDARKLGNATLNYQAQKRNTDERLTLAGVKRRGLEMYFKRIQPTSQDRPPCHSSSQHNVKAVKPVDKSSRKGSALNKGHPQAATHSRVHELRADNVSKLGLEGDQLRWLIDIQHREITPEDYELLLLLENAVAPRTVDRGSLHLLVVVPAETLSLVGEICAICMELFELSQAVKVLPCRHSFHSLCIDHWLSNSSQDCPLDGLAVFSS